MKFKFLKKLSRWPTVFFLQISFELKVLEHNVYKRIGSFEQFRTKGKNVQILNMSRFRLFGDQMFGGHFAGSNLQKSVRLI